MGQTRPFRRPTTFRHRIWDQRHIAVATHHVSVASGQHAWHRLSSSSVPPHLCNSPCFISLSLRHVDTLRMPHAIERRSPPPHHARHSGPERETRASHCGRMAGGMSVAAPGSWPNVSANSFCATDGRAAKIVWCPSLASVLHSAPSIARTRTRQSHPRREPC